MSDTEKRSWAVRPANSGDVIAVSECVNSAYRHYVDLMGKLPGPMTEDYLEVIRRHEVHVVESAPAIAGSLLAVLVLIASPGRFLLDNVAVQPKAQGIGIGGSLIAFAERRAIQSGYDRIQLYTHECMTENLDMYPKLGYHESGRLLERGYQRVYFEKRFDLESGKVD